MIIIIIILLVVLSWFSFIISNSNIASILSLLKPFAVKVKNFLSKWWLISDKSAGLHLFWFMWIWDISLRLLIYLLIELSTVIVLQVILTLVVVRASIPLYFSLISMHSVTFTLEHSGTVFIIMLPWMLSHHSCFNCWIFTSKAKLLENFQFSLHFWRHDHITFIVW